MPLIIVLIFAISTSLNHDYHIGLTEIEYNKESKSLQTSIRLFTDDLDKALSKLNSQDLNLNTEDEIDASNQFINDYLIDNLSFQVNRKDVSYQYLGRKYENDVIWLFIEVEKVKKIKEFKVMNSLLFETFNDQKHLLNVNLDGNIRSKTLEEGYSSFSISL